MPRRRRPASSSKAISQPVANATKPWDYKGGRSPSLFPRAVRAVEGVRSLSFRENPTGATAVIDGITLVAHSIWACVEGGTNIGVATALMNAKTAGAAYNGAVSQVVTEPASGQEVTVMFDRPVIVVMQIRVTITGTSTISGPEEAVRNALLAYAQGEQVTGPGFIVGEDVSPFELSAAVNLALPGVTVTNMEVRQTGGTYQNTNFVIAVNQLATLISGDIEVLVT